MSENQYLLEHSFERMVIDVLVYTEGCKDIECVTEVNLPWDSYIASKDWEKVSGMDYGVHMYDRHDPIPAGVEIGFDNPHAIVGIRVIKGFAKLVDERTRKKVIPDFKREK